MCHTTCSVSRRNFVLSALGGLLTASLVSAEDDGMPWSGPAKVRKVFLASQSPTWPRPDVDLEQVRKGIEAELAGFQKRHPGQIEFTGGELLRPNVDIPAWVAQASKDDVVLLFNLTSGLYTMPKPLLSTGRPTLLMSLPYSGHSWEHFSQAAQQGMPTDVIATSNYGDLDPYVAVFRAIHVLRNSKVVLVQRSPVNARYADYTNKFGTQVVGCSHNELKTIYEASDIAKARAAADEFIRGALRVVEPSREEIVDSLRMYHAMRELLRQQRANAIAVDCLGGFRAGELPAYPCVGFSKLNDEGLVGACGSDVDSSVTQLLITTLSGVPGFISDPVFDTSRNEVIHAHCVSATVLAGLNGPKSPYIVRSHLEDNKGVSMQVLAPDGGAVTLARFNGASSLLLSTGEAVGNVDDARACRTKIRTKVSDARKFLESYGPGLHRVLFYGDHSAALRRFSRLTATRLVQEI